MVWYTAKCFFRAANHDAPQEAQIAGEYRYLLIRGEDDEAARERTEEFARAKEHSYDNVVGGTTTWAFEEVVELKEILSQDLTEGVEVYYEYVAKGEIGGQDTHRSRGEIGGAGHSYKIA